MGNMSYCRFQNTMYDLQDCYDNMDVGGPDDDLSPEEVRARKHIIKLCVQIADDYGDELEDSSGNGGEL